MHTDLKQPWAKQFATDIDAVVESWTTKSTKKDASLVSKNVRATLACKKR